MVCAPHFKLSVRGMVLGSCMKRFERGLLDCSCLLLLVLWRGYKNLYRIVCVGSLWVEAEKGGMASRGSWGGKWNT